MIQNNLFLIKKITISKTKIKIIYLQLINNNYFKTKNHNDIFIIKITINVQYIKQLELREVDKKAITIKR